MENNQSTQQLSVAQSNRRHSSPHKSNSLLALLRRYPWLIWGGVWLLLLVISATALLSMTYTISLEPEPEQKPVAVETTQTYSQTGKTISLLMLGATVFTLTAGSLVIFKILHSASRSSGQLTRRQQRKLLLESQAVATQPQQVTNPLEIPAAQPGVMLPSPEQPLNAEKQAFIEVPGNSLPASAKDNLTQGNDLNLAEPVVTVLPPEENQVVEPDEESLAEKMDIRKHRSLPSILQDF